MYSSNFFTFFLPKDVFDSSNFFPPKGVIDSDFFVNTMSINFLEFLYLLESKLCIILLLTLMFFTMLEFYYPNEMLNKWYGFMSILSLFQILYSLMMLQMLFVKGIFFHFEYEWTSLNMWFKSFVVMVSMLCVWFAITFSFEEKLMHWEYYTLLLLSCIGNLLLISSCNLMTMYLSIELQGLCFYILASFKTQSNYSTEAAMKYFIQGAVASGIFLLGSSIIYWALGTTNMKSMYYIVNLWILYMNMDYLYNYIGIFLLGILFIIMSLLMKLAVAPFHMWAPDVYEGVPTSVTFIFAILPKMSLLAVLININLVFFKYSFYYTSFILLVCGLFSIMMGIFAALYQTKLKSWVAFAGVSHIGYIMLILTMSNILSMKMLLFYLIIYMMLSINIFMFFFFLSKCHDNRIIVTINELLMVFESNKTIMIFFALLLLSLIGMPPLMGFYNKYLMFYLFLIEKLYFLSMFLIILTVMSGFYYLRFMKKIFFISKNANIKGFLKKMNHFDAMLLSIFFFFNMFASIYMEELFFMISF